MKDLKQPSEQKENEKDMSLNKKNYIIIAAGILITIIGYFLMSGGGTDNRNEFDEEALFSFRRITLSSIMVIGGYGVVIYGLFKGFKAPKEDN